MENYEYLFKSISFEDENLSDDKCAGKLRKKLALNFYSGLELGETNRFVCDLLRDDLETYAKTVDGVLDNYKPRVLDSLPSNFQGRFKQWKCGVSAEKAVGLLSKLPCAEEGLSKWQGMNCARSRLTEKDVALLNKKEEVEEERRKVPQPRPVFFQPKKVVEKEEVRQEELPKFSAFRSASEELRLQNAKKFGGSFETRKKTLGGKRSVHPGRFNPPRVLQEGEELNLATNRCSANEPEIDERLKNIDPKMIEVIQNEIMDSGPKLTWDDIAGLEFAKKTIQEVVVWPMLRPDIFTGLRRPPRGILLFGPPGTGKTLIGKCIASQSGATFLSISASSLTSKWVGDGEKMVRALFAVARVNQPSVVFIDEIDSLLSQRSDTEHESSRRIKTEFLVQLDGVGTGDEDKILIIGATNRPQELDEAARRRLVKRLYIPLPETNARADIIRALISKERHDLTDPDITEIANLTEGYSGADMKHVCQEASLGPIRSIPAQQICNIDIGQVRAVSKEDFISALTRVKSTVSPDDLHNYLAWNKQFGL